MSREIIKACLGIWCVLASILMAQDPRGSLRGRVSDPAGSVIPGVEVSVTNLATTVTTSAETNDVGSYNIPFLLPGTYTVSAERQGFKKFIRDGIQIRVSDTVELNISMELGSVTETVEVKAETPLLDTAGSSLGQVMDERRVLELPIAAGNPLELSLLTPGMVEPSKFLWKPAWNYRDVASEGNPAFTGEYQIDGVSNTFAEGNTGRSRYAFAPPSTAVREFKMETSPYDASVGHTMSSVVNVSTASGTNEFHGEAHWFVRNSALDARNFFNNKRGTDPAAYRDNRYGASAGGPVWLPRVYNGKNRTFWFYAWEANKWDVPQTYTGTVPTGLQRNGDFSQLLALGSRYQIYDPFSIAPAPGGRFSRQPLTGNIVPKSRLDTVGVNLVKLYPLPNQPGTADGRNNYFNGTVNAREDYYVHLARVDHAWSENHRMFVRLDYDFWEEDKNHYFSNDVNGIVLNRINRGLALDDVLVLSPTLVLNVRYGLTSQDFPERRSSQGFDLASVGFSPSLVNLVERNVATIPRFGAGAYSRFSNWESGDGTTTSMTHSFVGQFSKLHRAHNLKFGIDARIYRAYGNRIPRMVSPDLSYSSAYTRGPLDNSAAAPVGQELAAALFGIPDGSMERTASFAMQDVFIGTYFHDDLKVSSKLTLNFGVRYELESPLTERFNRLVAGYAFDTPNPIEAQAKANYALNPIPELSPGDFRVLGGLNFVNDAAVGRSPFRAEKNNFMPRFGLSYQFLPNTTLRAGYGIYYDSIGVNSTRAIQTGFSQSTPIQASLDEGLTYVATNANPFPNGLLEPLGAKGGLTTNLGQPLEFYDRNRTHPYAQRWSFGLQQLLPLQFLAEATYVGNRATRLSATRSLNNIPAEYMSTTGYRDQQTLNFLSEQFPNPFLGTNPIYGEKISRAGLLQPYPQFGSINVAEPVGYSWYHSLQVRGEKRFSHGYTFQLAYTWSKLMEAVEFMNPTDPRPYESVGNYDRTHRLAMSWIWEVPVGHGRRFGSRLPGALDLIAGGWQFGGVVVRQSGAALGFGNSIFNGDLHDIPLPKGQRDVDRWFNTEAGFNRNTAEQLVYNIRTLPLRFSGLRGDGRATWDLSAIKNFQIHEKVAMQFRAESYNSWNHPNFNNPNTSPTSSAFGSITGAAEGRNFQFSLKLKF